MNAKSSMLHCLGASARNDLLLISVQLNKNLKNASANKLFVCSKKSEKMLPYEQILIEKRIRVDGELFVWNLLISVFPPSQQYYFQNASVQT